MARALVLILLLGADAVHAEGNKWWMDESTGSDSNSCGKLYSGDMPGGIANDFLQCLVARDNSQIPPDSFISSYSGTVKQCSISPPTLTAYGQAVCNTTLTTHMKDGSSSDYDSHSAMLQCPMGTLWISSTGIQCKPIVDTDHCPICRNQFQPSFGNPIFPLTGARIQSQDLGVSLAGRPIQITYDTTRRLPVDEGKINFTLQPPASFGPLWTSSLHIGLALLTQGGPASSAFGGVVIQRGATQSTFTIDNDSTCGTVTGQNTNT